MSDSPVQTITPCMYVCMEGPPVHAMSVTLSVLVVTFVAVSALEERSTEAMALVPRVVVTYVAIFLSSHNVHQMLDKVWTLLYMPVSLFVCIHVYTCIYMYVCMTLYAGASIPLSQ